MPGVAKNKKPAAKGSKKAKVKKTKPAADQFYVLVETTRDEDDQAIIGPFKNVRKNILTSSNQIDINILFY